MARKLFVVLCTVILAFVFMVPCVLAADEKIIEDFESYGSNGDKVYEYADLLPARKVNIVVDENEKASGKAGGRFEFDMGSEGYLGVVREFAATSWEGYDTLQFSIKSEGMIMACQFITAQGAPWTADNFSISGDWTKYNLTLKDFKLPGWYSGDAKEFDLSAITGLVITFGAAESTGHKVYIDDIKLVNSANLVTAPAETEAAPTETKADTAAAPAEENPKTGDPISIQYFILAGVAGVAGVVGLKARSGKNK